MANFSKIKKKRMFLHFILPVAVISMLSASATVKAQNTRPIFPMNTIPMNKSLEEGITDYAKKYGVSFEEAKLTMTLATTDLAIQYCNFSPHTAYHETKKLVEDSPVLKNMVTEYYNLIYEINIYSRENWCAEYANGMSIFYLDFFKGR